MHVHLFSARPRLLAAVIAIAMLLLMLVPVAASARASTGNGFYQQTNLVSDISGVAPIKDPNLVNPWGLSRPPSGPWWVADNGTGVSTLYNGSGKRFPIGSPLVVKIPPPKGSPRGTTAAPTGNVFNPFNSTDTGAFVVSNGTTSAPSIFIFDTEDGTISGWNPNVDPTHAILAVDNSASGAVYKGLAIASNGSDEFLYAANFHAGTIDVFNEKFKHVTLSGSFTDSGIPAGFAPFNIQNIGGKLYVTYAKQDAAREDDVPGSGNGFVDVFDTNGNFIKRLVSHDTLNSPWGLTLAPANFGPFSNDLLVGNFGNGRIHAFNPNTGAFLGTLQDKGGHAIRIDGLWALVFGNGGLAGQTNELFFSAGIGDEAHGLFGKITFVS